MGRCTVKIDNDSVCIKIEESVYCGCQKGVFLLCFSPLLSKIGVLWFGVFWTKLHHWWKFQKLLFLIWFISWFFLNLVSFLGVFLGVFRGELLYLAFWNNTKSWYFFIAGCILFFIFLGFIFVCFFALRFFFLLFCGCIFVEGFLCFMFFWCSFFKEKTTEYHPASNFKSVQHFRPTHSKSVQHLP